MSFNDPHSYVLVISYFIYSFQAIILLYDSVAEVYLWHVIF